MAKTPDPSNVPPKTAEEVAAAARRAIKGKARKSIPLSDLVELNTKNVEVIKGNQHRSGGWLHAPAAIELFKAAGDRLHKLLELRNIQVPRVKLVRVARLKGTKVLYIFPTHDDDHEGIEVSTYSGHFWINLVTMLGPAGLTLPTGYKDRFAVDWAGEDSPVGPALMLDLDKQMERHSDPRSTKRSKKKAAAPAPSPAVSPAPSAEAAPDTPTESAETPDEQAENTN